ncbi:coproporphyrinogen III oxidase [Photobacterium aphoticum]|uniref:Coproporphyrinogen III oxidase n=1 Tax=Photobacterium aphoticum TaxID=754436 RepID=A0A090QPP7_9GAMM|nr:coproporphyrinogen III oxidase [Photobacterium aphoticum]
MDIRQIFDTGLLFHHYTNTAYPLTPTSFRHLRVDTDIAKRLADDMDSLSALSLYVHVPFCQVRCKFCEYTVLDCCDEAEQTEYVDLLLQEMAMYSQLVKDKPIMGFDLGGGTPSILSVENLTRLTQAVTDLFTLPEEVVWSVETTPAIAAKQPEKSRHCMIWAIAVSVWGSKRCQKDC